MIPALRMAAAALADVRPWNAPLWFAAGRPLTHAVLFLHRALNVRAG